jgi:signal peptidase
VGSLIYVKSVDYKDLKEKDVITFMLDENTVATHRIEEVVPDEIDPTILRYRTKGDANDAEDGELIHYRNVIGTPVFSIPYLGYMADYIQHPPGMYVAISAGAVLLLLIFLPDLLADDEKKKTRKRKNIMHTGCSKNDSTSDEKMSAKYNVNELQTIETKLAQEHLSEK